MSESFILVGDCREALREMPDKSVHCCVTSPPYFGLRDYNTAGDVWGGDPACAHVWEECLTPSANGSTNVSMEGGTLNTSSATRKPRVSGFCVCGAWRGELGLEPTPDLFVSHIVEVFREVRRVLRDDGTLWLNLGDSYAGSGRGGNPEDSPHKKQRSNHGSVALSDYGEGRSKKVLIGNTAREAATTKRGGDDRLYGHKPKDLLGIPWLVALALRADGWYLRSDIVWHKPNPMPESVRDRPTRSHEYIFLLSKSAKYYYDADAVAEPATHAGEVRWDNGQNGHGGGVSHAGQGSSTRKFRKQEGHGRRHAGFNERYFDGEPAPTTRNRRDVWKIDEDEFEQFLAWKAEHTGDKTDVWTVTTKPFRGAHFATFPPDLIEPCILAGCPGGGTVLDPFFGAGTTGLVAQRHGRNWIGCELNEEYAQMALERIQEDAQSR